MLRRLWQGAPVTTLDFDFFFRKTAANLRKLKAVAGTLGAVLLKPYCPASDLIRLVRDENSLQVDFMATIHGVTSFASLRNRATRIRFSGYELLVADLSDIVRSKRAAARPPVRAVLEILERTRLEKKKIRKEKA